MGGLWVRAISSGVFFGIWPLFMKRAGINNANVATMIMEAIVLSVLLPRGMWDLRTADLSGANWWFLMLSAVSAAMGVLIFNGGVERSSTGTLSTFIVIVILVQVLVNAIYKISLVGNPTSSELLGFVFAAAAAYLLTK